MIFDVQRIQDSGKFEDFIFAYKIVEKKYVKSIIEQGQIYFGLLENYRKMEQQDKYAVGDSSEASLTKKVNSFLNIGGKWVEIHGPNVGYNSRINANQCAFCLYAVGLQSCNEIAENELEYTIPYSTLEAFCKDKGGINNCSIIVFELTEIRKIYDALRQRKLPFSGNRVIYDNFDYIPQNRSIQTPEYAIECCFHKDKRFAYQREFRIVARNTANKPIDDLFIDVHPGNLPVLELKKIMLFSVILRWTRRPSVHM